MEESYLPDCKSRLCSRSGIFFMSLCLIILAVFVCVIVLYIQLKESRSEIQDLRDKVHGLQILSAASKQKNSKTQTTKSPTTVSNRTITAKTASLTGE